MATVEEVNEASGDAQLALLRAAKASAEEQDSTRALMYAEAFAWVRAPGQPHGSKGA